ncbi:MAG: long-chain fatty acid--CoA ligase [Bradyrhizobiaceae bacterium PARB1]|jgi:acyl-CoA synthetase (AMP-forming)/AMP-acid ligase II|nr:MAG: long-chain fatty acid--CoA ligase [Bradyrhizobiaceae bacterium PARB1]
MISIEQSTTIGDAFALAAAQYGSRPFLAAPQGEHRSYHRDGYEIDYATAAREVSRLRDFYSAHGYGHGHRIAVLLDNRPEHFLHKLAMNTLGISCVPVNPDYRANEIAHLLQNSDADLALVAGERIEQMSAGIDASARAVPIANFDDLQTLAHPQRSRIDTAITGATEASVLYTSGTTGRPKGCLLSHHYELESGAWYASRGHLAAFHPEGERLYNPLPVYHVNSSVMSFQAMMLSGGCQIQADRFAPSRWWDEVCQTRASIIHYLGIIVPLLLGLPETAQERAHGIRFGIGAGVEPQLHAEFERRFGFPLVEVWGMTEMVRVIIDNEPLRQVGTRAFGRVTPGIEVRVVDERDVDVPAGTPGEMVIRHSAEIPRGAFFSGYLKDEEATANAWRGGWFHTGDTVRQDPDGMLHFVDRKKNIIRRSGENIAAAEIEAVLQAHDLVKQVAVLAVPDELREEEVYACVVLAGPHDARAAGETLFAHCHRELAYFKTPGWLLFVDSLPTTGTQKIQKQQIFTEGIDPRTRDGVLDFRNRKKRDQARSA